MQVPGGYVNPLWTTLFVVSCESTVLHWQGTALQRKMAVPFNESCRAARSASPDSVRRWDGMIMAVACHF